MGTPTFTSPLHYDSSSDGQPGIHADIAFNAGVGVAHTISGVTVVKDANSPYNSMILEHADSTFWVSPVIPVGSRNFNKNAINSAGFTVLEDIRGYTAQP